jgi:hypothetical protein
LYTQNTAPLLGITKDSTTYYHYVTTIREMHQYLKNYITESEFSRGLIHVDIEKAMTWLEDTINSAIRANRVIPSDVIKIRDIYNKIRDWRNT